MFNMVGERWETLRCLWLMFVCLHFIRGKNISQYVQERPSCQAGFYCPQGSVTPVPCPKGTYGASTDAISMSSCLRCPPQHYCPKSGLSAPLPCGPAAKQPLSGQETCLCLGEGQSFQSSDGKCQCTLDYQPASHEDACVHKVYSICRDGKTRTQHGDCLDRQEWSLHCRQQVCPSPDDYEGYDGELGLCVCTEPLGRAACGGLCRNRPATEMKLWCSSGGELELVLGSGTPASRRIWHNVSGVSSVILETIFKQWDSHGILQCSSHLIPSRPVYIVRTSGEGFLGVLSGIPEELEELFLLTQLQDAQSQNDSSILWGIPKMENISNDAGDSSKRWTNRPTGIVNPTACLHLGDVLLFTVSTQHYPFYDIDNLYNTNTDYDWGAFRKLEKELTLSWPPPGFFSVIFNQPGVYVLTLSSHQHKHLYVRVMPAGGQCYEPGPFFSTIPRHMTRVGIRKRRNLLLRPDWLVTGGLLFGAAVILCLCVTVLILFHEYGWPEKKPIRARYHTQQMTYRMDDYASKGSRVISRMKIHRKQQARMTLSSIQPDSSEEFWDYEHQVDLEAFSSNTFYSLLLKHSLTVTTRLGQLTTEVKELYQGVIDKLRLLHPRSLDEESTVDGHEKMRIEVEKEVVCRRSLAAQLRTLLDSQLQVLRREQQAQQRLHSVFTAQVRECTRILGKVHGDNHTSYGLRHQYFIQRLRSLVAEMGELVSAECQRQGAWGLLGEGTGAKLLCPDSGCALSKDALLGSDGSLLDGSPLYYDPVIRLIRPNAHCHMLLSSGHTMAVPPDFFLHPHTGRVLPIAGNVAYDPESSTLVITTDSCADSRTWESPLIPFVPYPTSCHSKQPLHSVRLSGLRPGQKLQLGAPMSDPDTGVPVPILAVTIHPQTGLVYPLGKTQICPITRMLQPVQASYPMLDPRTGNVVLTVGVSLDPVTGVVLPVCGVLLGESFVEPLSGRMVRVGGASIRAGQLVPHAGGYQTLLDSKVLAAMFKLVELLRPLSDEWGSDLTLELHLRGKQGQSWQDCISAASHELHSHWRRSQHCQLQMQTRLDILLDTTMCLHQDGGSLGDMPLSDPPVPALLGIEYPDPMGSGLSVPVLGCATDLVSGRTIPLTGTMEDPDGRGLVAISYASQTVDPVTGMLAPVVGARLDVRKNTVVPVTASYWLATAAHTDSIQVEALDKEVCARNTYWQQHSQKEEDALSGVDSALFQCFVTEHGGHQVRWSGRSLKQAAVEMHDLAQMEAQRRTARRAGLALVLPPHVLNILCLEDEEEWDQHCVWYTELLSVLDMMDVCKEQLQEKQENWSTQRVEWTASFHVMDREPRLGEMWEQCSSRLSDLDAALVKLQCVRHLSKLRGDTAQAVLLGNFWYKEYGLIRFCRQRPAMNIFSLLQQKILPLLERMNQEVPVTTNTCHQFGIAAQSLRQLVDSQDTGLQTSSAQMHGSQKQSSTRVQECSPDSHITLPTIPEEEWTRLLERSPLFQLLKRVELQLKHGAIRAPHTDNCLVDVLECQWECEGELIPLDPSVLKPEEFVAYQHGLSLMHSLHCLQLTPDISLHIAASLPSNNYHNNAFRNSFFYQEADETLFVRRQRLQSVGGFSLLLLHCLSHVAVKDMSTDSAPDFQRLFCKVLQACLGELFNTKLGLDDEPPQEHLKGTLSGCGDAFLCLPQHDVEEVDRKNREMSLFSHLEGVLRKRIIAAEEGHQPPGENCKPLWSKEREKM
ncbi:uncharacterized protein si:dkey-103g5.4 isoform X2 [Dunckerocampus dactyliophorus]|uniref:uncharacterized protein si:dkey-103g5.4 isoform X2 n=1 Tax=Dunckerocampus dactyliophorus TaxID=161453 RepID=UPI002404F40C|nr:uncharacterized protein si:dkey-103g5.4 isoform X2 [Dunckerocampus dactyliophorus]